MTTRPAFSALGGVARSGASRGKRSTAPAWSMQHVYRPYVRAALLVAILLGFSTGTAALLVRATGYDAGTSWISHIQAHGAIQIFGWAGLFTIGIAWHVIPRFKNSAPAFPWPQRLTLGLIVSGIILRFAGQTAPASEASRAIAIAGAFAVLAGIAVFVLFSARTLARGEPSHSPVDRWLWAGLLWAGTAGVLHLAATWAIPAGGPSVVPVSLQSAFVFAGIFGFLANFAFGISQRAVVGLLGLRPTHARLMWLAYGSTNLGTAVAVAARLWNADPVVFGTGAIVQAAGLASFVVALRVLEPSASPRPEAPGTYPRYPLLVGLAYGWLALGTVLMAIEGVGLIAGRTLVSNLAAPVLHTVALGFITTLIMGMTSRMLPLFEGAELPAQRLVDLAVLLHVIGLALRIGLGIAAPSWAQPALAASGLLGFFALVLFAFPAFRVMGPAAREAYRKRATAIGAAHLARVTVVRRREGPRQRSPGSGG